MEIAVEENQLLIRSEWVSLVKLRANRKCERCGSSNRPAAHHKDRDKMNNRLVNGECLCGSCHAREHLSEKRSFSYRAAPVPIVHGTQDGYGNHKCRCRPCKDAHAKHQREYLRRRALKLGPCTTPSCTRGQYAKGLCRACYAAGREGTQRKKLVLNQRPKALHGSRSKYRQGCRCADCQKANRDYQRTYMRVWSRKKHFQLEAKEARED